MPTTYAIPNGRTVMDATTYTGTNASLAISNVDNGTTGFKPDLTWIKSRNNSAQHCWYDTVRGPRIELLSNSTSAEVTEANGVSLTAFNTGGFQLGTENAIAGSTNVNGWTYVAWQWNAGSNTTSSNTNGSVTSTVSVNQTAGFSVISWAGGQGANYTIGHGLSTTPSFFIAKSRGSAENWGVYYTNNGVNTNWMTLNGTGQQGSQTGSLAGGAFVILNSTTIQIDAGSYANANNSMIGYCWAAIPGFSSFGKFVGNGSTDGTFIYTGFRPKFIMYKPTNVVSATDWVVWDTTRNPYNVLGNYLLGNTTGDEGTATILDVLSNGWKMRTTSTGNNGNGDNIIYMAFAENPFKYANAR